MNDESWMPATGATLSRNGAYRYDLWRTWNPDKSFVMFIGLNPSTADGTTDDPTIRRCKRFAADWGFGGIYMLNLFAFRATKPADMIKHPAPRGPDNDRHLHETANRAGLIVCAWGNDGGLRNRDREVINLLSDHNLWCLGKTKSGNPRHPLYIKADKQPEIFIPTIIHNP